jgi:dTDP-D-glucose 4,6-dehydratase
VNNKILITGGNGLVGSEFIGEQYVKPTSKEYNLITCWKILGLVDR